MGCAFFHGMGFGGKHAHVSAATENRQSIVMGHVHSNAGVRYLANEANIIFGLAVGCGIDRHAYAFRYGRDFAKKPIIGCGIVYDDGHKGQFIPMRM